MSIGLLNANSEMHNGDLTWVYHIPLILGVYHKL